MLFLSNGRIIINNCILILYTNHIIVASFQFFLDKGNYIDCFAYLKYVESTRKLPINVYYLVYKDLK